MSSEIDAARRPLAAELAVAHRHPQLPGRSIARLVLLCGTLCLPTSRALAQAAANSGAGDDRTIVVTATRMPLNNVPPERDLNQDDVAAYGVDTVEDLFNEIGAEVGDDEPPVIIVNGERVESLDDIAGYPPEAVSRLQVLPRGSGAAAGGSPRQRVYSLVLRDRMRSLALSGEWKAATEGDWTGRRGQATLTRIKGPNRFNLTLRANDEDDLLESDRGILQPPLDVPYDLIGNVIPDPRDGATEIDPALSALAGQPVTVAGVPGRTAAPDLAAFATTAGSANVTYLGQFRTLRSSFQGYDADLSMNNRLARWLRLSLTARANWSHNGSLLGLPYGTFVLPADSPFSPFQTDVGIAAYGKNPLRQRFSSFTGAANGTLNATAGRWLFSVIGNYGHGERSTMIDRQDFAQLSQPILVGPQINPFAGELGDLLTIFHDRSRALVDDRGLQLRAVGSPFALPAGRLRLTAYGGFGFHRATTRDVSGNAETLRRYHRNETTFVASAEIPLASRRNGFLPQLGELSASFEFGVVDYSDVGTFTRHNYALTWSPIERLRLQASTSSTPRPADLRVIADPVLIIPGARYFDFLTGDTVDVTQISGGNPSLAPERLHTDRLTATLSPMRSINLQLNAEYSRTRTEGFISGVPPASAAIELAFADRFARDANGRLVSVDVRPVNFDEQRQQQFRYGLSFGVPLGPPPRRAARAAASTEESATGDADPTNGDPQPPPSGPRPRLQFSVWHTILLSNRVLIRPGLAPIDLLSGGAIGISGSPPRHAVTANVTISGNGLGLSLAGAWRSESRIQTLGIGGSAPDTLRFAPIFTASLRAYANLEPLLPGAAWLKDTRLSLSVTNLTDQRQRVADLAGATPLSYQAAYRDPVGRTIGIELRKVF